MTDKVQQVVARVQETERNALALVNQIARDIGEPPEGEYLQGDLYASALCLAVERIAELEAALLESMSLNINYHAVEEPDGYQFTEAPAVIAQARAALGDKHD